MTADALAVPETSMRRRELTAHSDEPRCAGPDPEQLVERFVTPTRLHFVRNHGPVPTVDRATYRLHLDGLVQRTGAYGLHELAERFELHEQTVTLQCAGNRRQELHAHRPLEGEVLWAGDAVSTATWRGIRLVNLLFAAGIAPEVSHVWFEGLDSASTPDGASPFGSSISIERALRPDVLIAFAMNGEPLTPDHGAPARLVVPGVIGARSVKWLGRVTLSDRPSPNHFQSRGYRIPDPVTGEPGPALEGAPVNAYIAEPGDGAALRPGATVLRGYATPSGTAAVVGVEIQVDGGPWQRARLVDQARPATWVRWECSVVTVPGVHRIRVRAWDSSSATQPDDLAATWNERGYFNNAVQQIEVTVR